MSAAGCTPSAILSRGSLLANVYRRAGFQLVRREQHHSFGRSLIGETWELRLGSEVRRRRT